MKSFLRATPLAALVLAGACDSPSGSGGNSSVREVGYVQFRDAPVEVTVPATARAGQAFTVRVVTRATGCSSADDTEVLVVGFSADVTPYDIRTTGPNLVCGDEVQVFTHTAPVLFDTPGEATVRVHGRREPGDDAITITRAVTVQPAT